MKVNRGVKAMIPSKPIREKKPIYDFKLRFVLFKKEFSLWFKVNSKME
jgi:hypothetical protein